MNLLPVSSSRKQPPVQRFFQRSYCWFMLRLSGLIPQRDKRVNLAFGGSGKGDSGKVDDAAFIVNEKSGDAGLTADMIGLTDQQQQAGGC
jgi:hypothetical protein